MAVTYLFSTVLVKRRVSMAPHSPVTVASNRIRRGLQLSEKGGDALRLHRHDWRRNSHPAALRRYQEGPRSSNVVMQGRYIHHQALKAIGGRERITMVTPFRPRDPLVRDEILLVGVRGISNLAELYPQYYRLEVLEERMRAKRKAELAREIAYRPFNLEEERAWIRDQRDYLDSMLNEMYEVE